MVQGELRYRLTLGEVAAGEHSCRDGQAGPGLWPALCVVLLAESKALMRGPHCMSLYTPMLVVGGVWTY